MQDQRPVWWKRLDQYRLAPTSSVTFGRNNGGGNRIYRVRLLFFNAYSCYFYSLILAG